MVQQEEEKITIEVESIEEVGTLKKKITVSVPEDEVNKKLDENFGELARTAQVPGFRIGRAPRKLIEKRFGKEVRDQVKNLLVAQAIERVIEEENLTTIGEPNVELDKIDLPESGALRFSFEVEVAPEFELPKLEGIKLTEEEVEITNEDIDNYIESVRWQFAELKELPKDSVVEKNDHLDVDYVLEIEGQSPIVKHNVNIRASATTIEDVLFENLGDELAGLKVGDKKEVEVTIPDTHQKEELRGKKVKFEVIVKKIHRWIRPELNDEFVKRVGFNSLDEWKDAIRTELEAQQGQRVRRELQNQVKEYLLSGTNMDLPEGLTARATERALMRRIIELQQMGFPPALIEQKMDELRESAKKQAVEDLKLMFIIDKIAKEMGVEVSDDEANSLIASIAFRSGRRPERLRAEMIRDGRYDNVIGMIKENKVIEKLIDSANIEKKKKAREEKSAKKSAKSRKKGRDGGKEENEGSE